MYTLSPMDLRLRHGGVKVSHCLHGNPLGRKPVSSGLSNQDKTTAHEILVREGRRGREGKESEQGWRVV